MSLDRALPVVVWEVAKCAVPGDLSRLICVRLSYMTNGRIIGQARQQACMRSQHGVV